MTAGGITYYNVVVIAGNVLSVGATCVTLDSCGITLNKTPVQYSAALSFGDSGDLTVDPSNLTYSLSIVNSSYGLSGQTLQGNLTSNSDGTFNITGTTYGKIFTYDNYSVMPVKIDPLDARYRDYFAKHPFITKSFYVPVIALKKSSLLITTDDVTSNNQSYEFRSVRIYQSTASGATSYSAAINRGVVTKINNTQFSVRYCTNNGMSSNNTQLQTSNCTDSIAQIITFKYDASIQSWLVTPVDSAHPSQIKRAAFVKDSITNQVIGYIDTADSTKNSAGFSLVAIAPADAALPVSKAASSTFTGYQLCVSDGNCASTGSENGVYYTNNLPGITSSSSVTIQDTAGGCRSIETDNSPANGYFEGVWGPGKGPCNNVGDRPDTAGFFIGQSISNGKGRSLIAIVGYDTTVTNKPSVKLTIGNIAEN